MSVNFNDNTARVQTDVDNAIGITLRLMLEGIHEKSNLITPMRPAPVGGTLRAEVLKTMEGNNVGKIKWYAPYAWYQERGYTTGPVRNYSTPGTTSHFAEKSVKEVAKNMSHYARLGGLIK